jgi:hypothetical protein
MSELGSVHVPPHETSPSPHAVAEHRPSTHADVPQDTMHPPQLLRSVLGSTQRPEHSTVGAGHPPVDTQRRATHACPDAQRAPHAPQFNGSVAVFTQPTPGQVIAPIAHSDPSHTPATHRPVHRAPQSPQLDTSPVTSTQKAPHIRWPAAHPAEQRPATQLCPGAHALPHAPQFIVSVDTSTHAPPQVRRGSAHALEHAPPTQL